MFKPRNSGSTPVEDVPPDTNSRQPQAPAEIAPRELDTSWLPQMVDNMPVTVMLVDPETSKITYLNKTGQEMLRPFRHLLDEPAGSIEGQRIEILHSDLAHERRVLADPDNLPWSAKVRLDEKTFDLLIAAIRDGQGRYIGPIATLVAQAQNAADTERQLAPTINQIDQIARQTGGRSQIVDRVATETRRTVALIDNLNRLSIDIGEAIYKIQDITAKTNLLTRNASTLSRQFRAVAALCAPLGPRGPEDGQGDGDQANRPARPRLQLKAKLPPRTPRS